MKRILTILLALVMALSLTACGGGNSDGDSGAAASSGSAQSGSARAAAAGGEARAKQDWNAASVLSAAAEENPDGAASGSRTLIAFFSHTGENHNVGVIEKGNTHIIADMIAEETGADLFEIKTVNPYPDTYDECTDVAKKEQNENARPEVMDLPDNLDGYDTVFIGYPIWWGDLPMAVYTFLESYDFSGKTIIPFCTHEGSGLSGTERSIAETCAGANVLDGFAVRGSVAQNEQEEAKADVLEWLDGLGL